MTTIQGPIYVSRTGLQFTSKEECIYHDIGDLVVGDAIDPQVRRYLRSAAEILVDSKRRHVIPEIIELLKQLPQE